MKMIRSNDNNFQSRIRRWILFFCSLFVVVMMIQYCNIMTTRTTSTTITTNNNPTTTATTINHLVDAFIPIQRKQVLRSHHRHQQQHEQQPPYLYTLQSTSQPYLSLLSKTKTSRLYQARSQADLDIKFGSDSNVSGSVSWGEDDDDTKVRQLERQKVQDLLQQSDNEMKEIRKQTLWGKYANITNQNELQQILQKEQDMIQKEFTIQKQIARQLGVVLEILEPRDENDEHYSNNSENSHSDNTKNFPNINIQIGSGAGSESQMMSSPWFAEMDEELRTEWESLTAQDGGTGTASSSSSSTTNNKKAKTTTSIDNYDDLDTGELDDDDEDDNDDDDNDSSTTNNNDGGSNTMNSNSKIIIPLDIVQEKNTGKLVARDALSGVRVGSAGGWTLEVFPGDFVVHRKYGIGRFDKTCLRPKTKLSKQEKIEQDQRRADMLSNELRQLKKKGGITTEDIQMIRNRFGTSEDTDPISNPQVTVLEITYKDAVVHVPVDRAYRLSRYRAGDAVVKPKLSRVKGETWSKTKRSVELNTLSLAQDVLALYATRETLIRQPFVPEYEIHVKQFEATFPYVPTIDQKKCFEDIENDMIYRNRPMDRLICGDVGFGKTEVALRALYRTCVNQKQCALLAPTGVLAAQHYKNILKRMGPNTPFNVTCTLLRGGMGKNTKNGREMRQQIADGTIQLIIGTHALLSNDLKFADLGLLVVDEEQRFGVKQKERLKLISNGVDVLTLSATPIPRTLQMSLSGIRDTSTIRSPPPMRKPVITYVQDFNEEMVESAIRTELERNGQCYYVVPRISMLNEAESLIKNLFPGIRIIQAHGRMQRNGAEENVAAFAEGNYDVLLATTVIENGVDIPTVNTIIVQNSQAFGISTLYQLRGRVGRSDVQAYSYFLHRSESVTEQAALRLQAIGELSELGAGFDVANRDLEIRGAGSLLGTEQSGLASKVGFDLYMRLLKKSIRKLRGLDLPPVPRTNLLLLQQQEDSKSDSDPTKVLQSISFRIPPKYIPNDNERLTEESKARLAESTSSLVDLTNAWKVSYGPLPASLQNQLKIMHLHACTRRLGIDLVGLIDSGIEIENSSTSDDPEEAVATRMDLVLRSPGLRPRHWRTILSKLPKPAAPRGLDVVFPARFTLTGDELVLEGGRVIDFTNLSRDNDDDDDNDVDNDYYNNNNKRNSRGDNDDNEEDWDAMDNEELEAMNEISSAVNVRSMDEIDMELYPRFVVKDFTGQQQQQQQSGEDIVVRFRSVDKILKLLLPLAKIVYDKQQEEASAAKASAQIREKQEFMRQRKKTNDINDAQRSGYRY